MASSAVIDRPAHVPADRVRDFDFYKVPGAETDVLAAWKAVQEREPSIFWTPHYGGHWVFTRADLIDLLQADDALFSYKGHSIPTNITPSLPLELDPPEHGPVRAILNPLFSPAVVRRMEELIRENTIELIEGFRHKGRCDFINDFGRQLPINLFLNLMDLPNDRREWLIDQAEIRVRGGNAEAREEAKRAVLGYIGDAIEDRRRNPGPDVLSAIVNAKLNGDPIPDATMLNLLSVVMFGGLDTVATMMGFVARFLAQNPEARRYLAGHPDRIAKSLDELLRRHSMTAGGRTVRVDTELDGVHLKAGDRVLQPTMLHGLDDRRFPDPMTVDFQRANAKAMGTFGSGPHRCPGANLACGELRIFIEEWLVRIPDFAMDPDEQPVMASGMVSAILKLPLVWDPATTKA